MTIAKVQSPDLDVFVGATGDNQLLIIAHIETEDGKGVTVEGEEKFEGVHEEDARRVVQQTDREEAGVRAHSHA